MDQERYKTIAKRARAVTRAYFVEEYAEDFAQYAALQFSRGRKATMNQVFIDFLRTTFGREETEQNLGKIEELLRPVEVTENVEPSGTPTIHSEIRRLQNSLEGIERAVFTLYCRGLTLEEIGDVFGVTEGRVGQHMMSIKRKLRELKDF